MDARRTLRQRLILFFLDTNILVYAWDALESEKRAVSRRLIAQAMAGEGIISTHILGEFASVLLHKMKPRVPPADVLAALEFLSRLRITSISTPVVKRAVEAQAVYGVHFYDGMVVAAADRAGCLRVYSEDLNHGQVYFSVEVQNPFL